MDESSQQYFLCAYYAPQGGVGLKLHKQQLAKSA